MSFYVIFFFKQKPSSKWWTGLHLHHSDPEAASLRIQRMWCWPPGFPSWSWGYPLHWWPPDWACSWSQRARPSCTTGVTECQAASPTGSSATTTNTIPVTSILWKSHLILLLFLTTTCTYIGAYLQISLRQYTKRNFYFNQISPWWNAIT